MSSDFNKTVRDFAKALQDSANSKTTPYDTQAVVKRVDGNTAWVHIEGGVDETPVKLTTNAKKGDVVQVRVSGGNAWLYGNATSPPTDDTKANEANKNALVADEHATNAVTSAMLAQQYADEAKQDASSAATAASRAWTKAGEAETAAGVALSKAEEAEGAAGRAESAASAAQSSAASASESADNAYNSASQAINQLSVIENIIGALDLIANNGTYQRTTDQEPLQDKWYFIRTGSGTQQDPYKYQVAQSVTFEYVLTSDSTIVQGKPYYTRSGSGTEQDPYVYTPVETPVQADLGTYYEYTNWYYYELTGVDQAIQNYVSSHLVLAGDSLFLQTNDGEGSTRLELNTQNGLTLYDQTGSPVAKYGTNTIIGNENGFHVKIDGTEIGFYQSSQKVAYINGNKLYITQSVVLQQMDIGTPVNDGGLGQWSWKVHEVAGMNNLYLKWLG